MRATASGSRDRRLLVDGVEALGLLLQPEQIDCLVHYLDLLLKWNSAFNLTAIRLPHEMVTRHLLDALSVLPFMQSLAAESSKPLRCLDLGSGAGIPGIILAIAIPETQWTLLDSNGKKTRFLVQCCHSLELDNVSVVNQRLEDFVPESSFDIVISRAFTQLQQMVEWLQHPQLQSSRLLAMKGQLPHNEIIRLKDPWRLENTIKLTVPGLEEARHLLVLKKHA